MFFSRKNALLISSFSLLACSALAAADATPTAAPVSSATPSAIPSEDGVRPATSGLYPIWENTGFVEKHREIYLGTNSADYGIGGWAQVGVEPVSFFYRTPNAYAKFSLYQKGRWHVAAQTGGYFLMNEASRAFLSPMYTSTLDNPDFSVTIIPVSLSATYEVGDWMQLHQTATLLGVFCPTGEIENEGYLGYMVTAELLAKRHHSVEFHAGEVGFWNHDFSSLGVSYRFHNSWLEAQIGYFYRFEVDGNQSAPMIALGFLL